MEAIDLPLVPARMLNEFVYCPRLAFLEWVDSEFAHSADTVEGSLRHRKIDRPGFRRRKQGPNEQSAEQPIAEPEAVPESPRVVEQMRSVELSDAELGLIAKIDVVETDGGVVQPVETKKGKRPHVEKGAFEPERVQVCAQGLLLRRHGHRCDSGVLYFAASHERVHVAFDEELVAYTLEQLSALRRVAAELVLPPPLESSPKCVRCSLAPICLPDEVRMLSGAGGEPRALVPAGEDRFPMVIQQAGAHVRKQGDLLQVYDGDDRIGEMRLREVSQVVLMGRANLTEPALRECLQLGIPVVHSSVTGWLYGVTTGLPHRNVRLRRQQFRAADDAAACLRIARAIVEAKILNQRTLLRRNGDGKVQPTTLASLKSAASAATRAATRDELMGVEGNAARLFFEAFGGLLGPDRAPDLRFDFQGRNRRPPRDPVNAMLSFGYAMLSREWVTACFAVGFDPYLGFLHTPHHGRPALALDLMEAFRPIVVDSVVLRVINNGEISPRDFIERMGYVNLSEKGRRSFLRAFEARLGQEITHPVFGYRLTYRRVFEVEARLLGRHLLGELPAYEPMTTR